MPLTTQSFSYNKKSNAIFVSFKVPNELASIINKVSNNYNSNISNTTRTLLYIALKNNFTDNLQYIPCKKISSIPIPTLHNKSEKNTEIIIRSSPKLLKKLTTLQKQYHHKYLSETIRSLLHIALQHNYNNNLFLQKAIPIKNNTQQFTSNNHNGIITIDKI